MRTKSSGELIILAPESKHVGQIVELVRYPTGDVISTNPKVFHELAVPYFVWNHSAQIVVIDVQLAQSSEIAELGGDLTTKLVVIPLCIAHISKHPDLCGKRTCQSIFANVKTLEGGDSADVGRYCTSQKVLVDVDAE